MPPVRVASMPAAACISEPAAIAEVRAHLGAGLAHDVDDLAHRAVPAVLAAGGDVPVDVVERVAKALAAPAAVPA